LPLAELQATLEANKQWLPIRPFLGKGGTVGGLVALGACGPERLRYGAARDLLLGLRFVSGKGKLVSTGGRVVKNVAGYDLGRLLAGSAGTLGFLTDLTLRVSSRPESCRAVRGCGPPEGILGVARELLRSNMDPAFVVADPVNGSASGPQAERKGALWRITAGFEGFGETVEAQVKRCTGLFAGSDLKAEPSKEYVPCHGVFEDEEESLGRFPFLLRADLPVDKVMGFVKVTAETVTVEGLLVDLGCGRVRAGISDLSGQVWEALCGHARALAGHILLEKAPDAFKRHRDVFGPPQPSWNVMGRIKDALDPSNIFSPGSLPGRK